MNMAGYAATEVACGWAEAVIKKTYTNIWAGAVTQKPPITPKKLTRTDRSTDIAGYRVAYTRLKTRPYTRLPRYRERVGKGSDKKRLFKRLGRSAKTARRRRKELMENNGSTNIAGHRVA